MALSDLPVVKIMGGSNLDATSAELSVHVVVGDYQYRAAGERQPDLPADEMAISFVLGMYGYGNIAEHGFGPRRRDHQLATGVLKRIFDLPQFAVFFFAVDLEVGYRG